MTTVSYCTTCKDRLWQLKKTLPFNLATIDKDCDVVLLDYHSTDGLDQYIKDNYKNELDSGKLKYYKLDTPLNGFDMALAKHISHTLATGDVLFNLDADNFVGDTINELKNLKDGTVLIPKIVKGTNTSRCGRIGVTKKDYIKYHGYDVSIRNMSNDDGVFFRKLLKHGVRPISSKDRSIPIAQTQIEKTKHTNYVKFDLPARITVIGLFGKLKTININQEM